MSNSDLLRNYQKSGLALEDLGRCFAPRDESISDFFIRDRTPDIKEIRFRIISEEIGKRGKAIVPDLMDFLREEIPQDRNRLGNCPQTSFSSQTIGFLTASGDPQILGILMEVLEGFHGTASEFERRAALAALERITYCSFRKQVPFHDDYYVAVEHRNAVTEEYFRDLDLAASKYRNWFLNEGKNPQDWLILARRRAHKILLTEDLDAIFCVISFLQHNHDDNTQLTVKRLGHLMKEFKEGDDPYYYTFKGREMHQIPIGNWMKLLSNYGAAARPYSEILIRYQKETGLNNWGGYENLSRVGGKEILAFIFESLIYIEKQVAMLNSDPNTPKGFSSADPRGWWYDSEYYCMLTIDQSAGRSFANNAERLRWWERNKDKSEETWLRENMRDTAVMADHGNYMAAFVFQGMFIELRYLRENYHPVGVDFYRIWLRNHIDSLEYDPAEGAFRTIKNKKKG